MLLSISTLNELHVLLKAQGIDIENRAALDEVGIKIAKFVLSKELHKNA